MLCNGVSEQIVTCFAFTCSIKVVVGAQKLALSICPTVIDAWCQVGTHIHLGSDIGARFKSGKVRQVEY